MRYISVFNLSSGMKVASSLISSSGEVVASKGQIATDELIKKIIAAGYNGVYVEENEFFAGTETSRVEVEEMFRKLLRNVAITQPKKLMQIINDSEKVRDMVETICNNYNLQLLDFNNYDNYTFMHSINVCILSLSAGVVLGLTDKELEVLGIGALIHDIGKTFIPSKILNKPSKLTAAEYEIIKEHPKRGYEYAERYKDIDKEAKLIILQHHEKLDGTGYPQGLKADDITYFSKIVAIMDIYDSLTTRRVYKQAYSDDEAIEIILSEGEKGKLEKEITKVLCI